MLDSRSEEIELEIEKLEAEPSSEMKELLSILEGDHEFEKQLKEIASAMTASNFDLSKLQTQILLLIENAMQKLVLKQNIKRMLEDLRSSNQSIRRELRILSLYLMKKYSNVAKYAMRDIMDPNDKKAILNVQMHEHVRKIMRRFVVYRIYQFMNPRRIAGETAKSNFVDNVIAKGLKEAARLEGMDGEAAARKYGVRVKDLAKKRNSISPKNLSVKS